LRERQHQLSGKEPNEISLLKKKLKNYPSEKEVSRIKSTFFHLPEMASKWAQRLDDSL